MTFEVVTTVVQYAVFIDRVLGFLYMQEETEYMTRI